MTCIDPYFAEGAFACGRCVPCLKKRARVWSHRILLESKLFADNAFVTLTYEGAQERLDAGHTRDWIKRLRRRFSPLRFRYFLVGEYGSRTFRPHYHAVLFGFPSCGLGKVVNGECGCFACCAVRETWGFGHVLVGELTEKSANYVSGYLLKVKNPQMPHFTRMSLKPGIGADAMWAVSSEMLRYNLKVSGALAHGKSIRPLGRYLTKKLKEYSGDTSPSVVPSEALSAVRAYAFANGKSVQEVWQEVFDKGEALRGRNETV